MNDLTEYLTKYTATYRCPDEIRNFKLRIKIKEIETSNLKRGDNNTNTYQKDFQWQQKCFSRAEKDFYSNINNCVTDLDKKYHAQVVKMIENEANEIIYSYIDSDDFYDDRNEYNSVLSKFDVTNHNLATAAEEEEDLDSGRGVEEYDFKESLVSSIRSVGLVKHFEKMYIMADFGDYVQDTWIKHEEILCTLKYDKTHISLSVFPDFTISKPYHLKIVNGKVTKNFLYFIENISDDIPENIMLKEKELFQKIVNTKTFIKKHVLTERFSLPPKNKLNVYLFFEILSARRFEYSDIYIQYFIDLPNEWICKENELLKGVTQTCYGKNEDGLAYFGHCFELVLEYNIQEFENKSLPKSPYIYFEVISKDTWSRFRTEGLAYKNLPISTPGTHYFELKCFRLCPRNLSGNLRRFFIGDCSNYDDITWIGIPNNYENIIINKFGVNTIGTGEISLRVNVVHQSQAFLREYNDDSMKNRERLIFEKLNSSSLIKSVEQVLKAFKKARKNMIEVRDNLFKKNK